MRSVITIGIRQVGRDLTHARQVLRLHGRLHQARRRTRTRNRVVLTVLFVLALLLLMALPALADGPGDAGKVWLSWMKDKDSHGNQVGNYYLRVSQGGVTDPVTAVGAFFLLQFWSLYVLAVNCTVWALDFVLQFRSLALMRIPAEVVAGVLNDTVSKIGVIGLVATVSMLISSIWVLRGRSGAGFGEMAVSMVIIGLLGTVLANPVGLVGGPDGVIAKSQEAGSALTVDMLQRGEKNKQPTAPAEPEQASKMVQSVASAKVLDVFIRTPSQLINYGMTFDGPGVSKECKAAYETATKGGSVGGIKDKCPKIAKDTIEHPQNSLVAIPVVMPAAGLLLIFVLSLLVATIALTALALFEAALFLLRLVKAILPGASREDLFTSVCTVAVCCALLIAAVMSVGVMILAIIGLFDQTRGWNVVPIYLFIDLLLFVMSLAVLVMAFRAKKSGKKFGRRAANAMSPKPVNLSKGPSAAASVFAGARTAASMASNSKLRDALGSKAATGAAASTSTPSPVSGGNARPDRPGAVRTTARLAGAVGKAAVAYTVGAPVAVPRATKAAQAAMTARKAALATKLQNTKGAVHDVTARKVQGVREYASEYKHNVGAAARWIGQGLTQTGGAMVGLTPEQMRTKPANTHAPSSKPGETPAPTNVPVKRTSGVAQLNQLRTALGQAPVQRPTPHRATQAPTTTGSGAEALEDLRRRMQAQRRSSAASTGQPTTGATRRHVVNI